MAPIPRKGRQCRLLEMRKLVSQTQNQHRIFIVDDEPGEASTLAATLKKQGFDATSFPETQQALDAARVGAPDLLISDVRMPFLSGIDLAIQLREHYPNCKVLLFSEPAAADLLETARANGHAFQLLVKPVQMPDLVRKVQMAFEFAAA
jgi:DNA-binding NtrC family response regulator